jgi:hypothetical protein
LWTAVIDLLLVFFIASWWTFRGLLRGFLGGGIDNLLKVVIADEAVRTER